MLSLGDGKIGTWSTEMGVDDATRIDTGCLVMLRPISFHSDTGCLLTVNGFVDDDVACSSPEDKEDEIQDHLFRVIVKLEYNMQKQLARATAEKQDATILQALKEKEAAEKARNSVAMSKVEPVVYGGIIQLYHVKSGKFVTLLPTLGGKHDKESRRLEVSRVGDEGSWFGVKPLYKYKSTGDRVREDEHVMLTSEKLGSRWSLHTSRAGKYETGGRDFYEVNIASRQCGWQIVLAARDPMSLAFGSCIRMVMPQADGFVVASCDDAKSNRAPYLVRAKHEPLRSPLNYSAKALWVVQQPERTELGHVKWDDIIVLRHMPSGNFLAVSDRPCDPDFLEDQETAYELEMLEMVSSRCYFQIESIEVGMGSRIGIHSMHCRLSFTMETDKLEPLMRSRTKPPVGRTTTGLKKEQTMDSMDSEKTSTKLYLHLTDLDKSEISFKAAKVLVASSELRESDAMQILLAEEEVARPAYWAVSMKMMLTRSIYTIASWTTQASKKQERGEYDLGIIDRRDKEMKKKEGEFHEICRVLKNSQHFLHKHHDGKPLHTQNQEMRQRYFREVKYIDACFRMIDTIWQNGFAITEHVSVADVLLNGASKPKPTLTAEKEHLEIYARRSMGLLFETIRHAFDGFTPNELYLEKKGYIDRIAARLAYGLGAEECFAALIRNASILEKVDINVLIKFVEFIRDLGPDATFFRFLRSCCSCNGEGIESMQQAVLKILYETPKLASEMDKQRFARNAEICLVHFKIDEHNTVLSPLATKLPKPPLSDFMGNDVPLPNVYNVSIRWYSEDNWAPMNRAGKVVEELYYSPKSLNIDASSDGWISLAHLTWVLLPAEFYTRVYPDGRGMHKTWTDFNDFMEKDEEVRAIFNAQVVLAQWVLEQLKLFAAVCMTRSINCVKAIRKEFTFQLLISAMYDTRLPPQVRAAFGQLMNAIYVDDVDHAYLEPPLEVRIYKAIEIYPADVELPHFKMHSREPGAVAAIQLGKRRTLTVGDHSPTKFWMLENLFRCHFASFAGESSDPLEPIAVATDAVDLNQYSSVIMESLRFLVSFGFLPTEQQLNEVIRTLLLVADGRTDRSAGVSEIEPRNVWSDEAAAELGSNAATPLLADCTPIIGDGLGGRPSRPKVSVVHDGPAETAERYSSNWSVMDTKVRACRLLYQAHLVAVDSGSSRICQIFKEHEAELFVTPQVLTLRGQVPEKVVSALLERTGQGSLAFNWDILVGVSASTIFLDLLMYEDDVLFEAALDVLFAWTYRFGETLDAAADCQLIATDEAVKNYHEIREDFHRLEFLLESWEVWANDSDFSLRDTASANECLFLLEKLRLACSKAKTTCSRRTGRLR
jgi:hypothetical protein